MLIGSRQRLKDIQIDPKITLGDTEVNRVSEKKPLGIVVDDQLLWRNHVDTTIAKVSNGNGMMRRMKSYVPKYTLMHVYNALLIPYFDYCSLVWDTCSNYLTENLQKLQNRAARVITGKTYEIRSREILSDLGWQPLEKRIRFKKATFMYNIKHNDSNKPMKDMFEISNNKFHNLRSNAVDFHIPKPKTDFMKKSISYSGALLWNNLPTAAKQQGITINKFKNILGSQYSF